MKFEQEELLKLVNKIKYLTPQNYDDEFCKGYHTAVMYFDKFVKGKNPFEISVELNTIVRNNNAMHD